MNHGEFIDGHVTYEQWPRVVKISTALTRQKHIKSHTFPQFIGFILIVITLLGIDYSFTNPKEEILRASCNFMLAIATLISAYSIKWINTNSSWEERLQHKSSSSHKIIYFIITFVLLTCLAYLIIPASFF